MSVRNICAFGDDCPFIRNGRCQAFHNPCSFGANCSKLKDMDCQYNHSDAEWKTVHRTPCRNAKKCKKITQGYGVCRFRHNRCRHGEDCTFLAKKKCTQFHPKSHWDKHFPQKGNSQSKITYPSYSPMLQQFQNASLSQISQYLSAYPTDIHAFTPPPAKFPGFGNKMISDDEKSVTSIKSEIISGKKCRYGDKCILIKNGKCNFHKKCKFGAKCLDLAKMECKFKHSKFDWEKAHGRICHDKLSCRHIRMGFKGCKYRHERCKNNGKNCANLRNKKCSFFHMKSDWNKISKKSNYKNNNNNNNSNNNTGSKPRSINRGRYISVLIDVSGSMRGKPIKKAVKEFKKTFNGCLKDNDIISIIAFSTKAKRLLKPTKFGDVEDTIDEILDKCIDLAGQGGLTALWDAIGKGLDDFDDFIQSKDKKGLSITRSQRFFVITDGEDTASQKYKKTPHIARKLHGLVTNKLPKNTDFGFNIIAFGDAHNWSEWDVIKQIPKTKVIRIDDWVQIYNAFAKN